MTRAALGHNEKDRAEGNAMTQKQFLRSRTINPRYNQKIISYEEIGQRIDGFDDEWIPRDVYTQPDPYELDDEALA